MPQTDNTENGLPTYPLSSRMRERLYALADRLDNRPPPVPGIFASRRDTSLGRRLFRRPLVDTLRAIDGVTFHGEPTGYSETINIFSYLVLFPGLYIVNLTGETMLSASAEAGNLIYYIASRLASSENPPGRQPAEFALAPPAAAPRAVQDLDESEAASLLPPKDPGSGVHSHQA